MSSQIWTPENLKAKPLPKFRCKICDDGFHTLPAYESHVLKCWDEHEDTLVEIIEEHRDPVWYGPMDPEWEAYNAALRNAGVNPEIQYRRRKDSAKKLSTES